MFIIWAVLLLISSALLADAVKYYEDHKTCNFFEFFRTKRQCEHLIVGTVCDNFLPSAVYRVQIEMSWGELFQGGLTQILG